ncbi:uncharacterized protein LACBIDRAFT_321167 [Laccaria bicolor S238N-H82]|uniref:Predicted protein n=1 Tax=Laccaria bicolor (strain S238N-H82 / ATCC MYA-4686) TaxID=486041 RepID=B0CNZ4_LACBS|nr:uncharacterized protein LACBIDRAFT_321167 [Laccaria bicolor S238N-H82]EDR16024.1 predicted protein [Laccaria bicolor S238N-H82]|eukprot:XP_001874232.1 predicted protein [Laccaria bicolor S238N-H82]
MCLWGANFSVPYPSSYAIGFIIGITAAYGCGTNKKYNNGMWVVQGAQLSLLPNLPSNEDENENENGFSLPDRPLAVSLVKACFVTPASSPEVGNLQTGVPTGVRVDAHSEPIKANSPLDKTRITKDVWTSTRNTLDRLFSDRLHPDCAFVFIERVHFESTHGGTGRMNPLFEDNREAPLRYRNNQRRSKFNEGAVECGVILPTPGVTVNRTCYQHFQARLKSVAAHLIDSPS